MASRSERSFARLLALPLRAWRRLRGRPPADWMGPDPASEAAARAAPAALDNRYEVLCLSGGPEELPRRLAEAGHRVFRIASRFRADGPLFMSSEEAPRLLEVSLRDGLGFEGLDALRRERRLGATVVVPGNPDFRGLAERLRRELHWPLAENAADAAALSATFPRLSIVIVTYNNRDLNRLCLDSVFARTEWPNFEVLVVDNDSRDGTRELLDEA